MNPKVKEFLIHVARTLEKTPRTPDGFVQLTHIEAIALADRARQLAGWPLPPAMLVVPIRMDEPVNAYAPTQVKRAA